MKLHEFFREIESTRFQSRYMLFSGFKLVRNALSKDQTLAALINETRRNHTYIDGIGTRILSLFVKHKDDPGASYDVAVAAYLFCLYRTDPLFAKKMGEHILEKGKLWWSVDLALHISRNMKPFAHLHKMHIHISDYAYPIQNSNWISQGEPKRLNSAALSSAPIVNGKYAWNISGQSPVNSPQKTKTLVLSV